MQKIYSHDLEDTQRLTKMMQEYLGLFHIMAEEDPGYRQEQMLQDAGIIPISNRPAVGSRPPGVSASIPQQAIDEMLREEQ